MSYTYQRVVTSYSLARRETSIVASLGAASLIGVSSFNTRTGAVVPATGDYTAAQITETAAAKILTSTERALIASALQAETDPVFTASEAANFVAGDKAKYDGYDENPDAVGARDLTGFPNRTDSTIAVDGSGVFSITPATSFVVWNGGVSYTKTVAETVNVTADNDETYIYYSAGVLTASTSVWDITGDAAPVAIVFKTGSAYALWDERHAHNRDRNWHEWAHLTIGARYRSGFAGTFDNTTLSIATGIFYDEDIEISVSSTQTACRLWYRNTGAASMTFESNVTTPYKVVSGALKYDNAGTLTSVSNNQYSSQWVYASPDTSYPVYVVVGQAQSNTITAARSQSAPVLPGLATAEWKLLYQVIYRNAGGTPTYIEAIDYRSVSTGPATTATVASHAALADRDAVNSHPETAISSAFEDMVVSAGASTLTVSENVFYYRRKLD